MSNTLIAVMLVVIAGIIGAFGALFFKKGSATIHRNIMTFVTNKYLYFGVALYVISTIFFVPALGLADLSLVYPLTSLTYIWVTLLSIKFLREKTNKYKWLGIVLILIGIVSIGAGY